jgi:Tol biopolymer transport system component
VQRTPQTWFQESIETCDLKGANRTVVVSDQHIFRGLCWLSDGRIVYARQESLRSIDYWSSDYNLWEIDIDGRTGMPTDKPKRITQWAGSPFGIMSASSDGKRLVLRKMTNQLQVYLGELTAGGTRMDPPRRLTNDEAFDFCTAWTPDSKAVLFSSERNDTWSIFKQGINQDTAEPVVTGAKGATVPRLSADDAWILYAERPTQLVTNDLSGRHVRKH